MRRVASEPAPLVLKEDIVLHSTESPPPSVKANDEEMVW